MKVETLLELYKKGSGDKCKDFERRRDLAIRGLKLSVLKIECFILHQEIYLKRFFMNWAIGFKIRDSILFWLFVLGLTVIVVC